MWENNSSTFRVLGFPLSKSSKFSERRKYTVSTTFSSSLLTEESSCEKRTPKEKKIFRNYMNEMKLQRVLEDRSDRIKEDKKIIFPETSTINFQSNSNIYNQKLFSYKTKGETNYSTKPRFLIEYNEKRNRKKSKDILKKTFKNTAKPVRVGFFVNLGRIDLSTSKIIKWRRVIRQLKSNETLSNFACSKEYAMIGLLRKCNYLEENALVNLEDYQEFKEFFQNFPGKTDGEKLWIIYKWISKNVLYDKENSEVLQREELYDIFKDGIANSKEMAELFKKMCQEINLQCKVVAGYRKREKYRVEEQPGLVKYYWNLVFVANKWRCVDVSRSNIGRSGKRRFNPSWFLTPPELFICTHFPINKEDQLICNPISFKEFETLPIFEKEFFILGLKIINTIVASSNNQFTLEVQETLEPLSISAQVSQPGIENQKAYVIKKDSSVYHIKFIAPKGTSIFTLFAGYEDKNLFKVLEFPLKNL